MELQFSDDITLKWATLESQLIAQFGKKPDVNAILFLIGIDELGFVKDKITKEQKQDLMHIATCKLLSYSGYYLLEGLDKDGWPHYVATDSLPPFNLMEQEQLLKTHIVYHFEQIDVL